MSPGSATVSPARRVAYDVLQQVAGGGFATDLLLARTVALSSRDAGLASQLVFGCLRFQGQLDFLIHHYSGRKLEQIEGAVKIVLRLGVFQLRYLDRVPVHAAVHETVELAKAHRGTAAGFVNAVLRKVNRTRVKWPDTATELSCPAWLLERWTEHFDAATARAIARAALEEPAKYIRLRPGEPPPAELELAATEIPGCFQVISGDTKQLRLQDIGSQAIVPLLELQPGDTFLDLCAAPGNKTAQAAETPILALACDISLRRILEIPEVFPRVVLDASQTLPFRTRFDKILVDTPCSGTGTLSRNPEIKWRVSPQDFERFAERQVRILGRALGHLRVGGRVVYATCSLERQENEDVVRQAIGERAGARIVEERWRLPGRVPGDGFYAAVITSSE
ncbi:MAG: transcription antitermination factor NusB [Bryobacteraceae bacterium]